MLQCEGITQILLQITTWVKYFLNQQVFKGITKCLKTYKTWRVYSPKTVTGRSKNCEIVTHHEKHPNVKIKYEV